MPNEEIEFLGRIDHQVKILGYRVELEEIESIISQYSPVQEVVVIKEDENNCLIAFYSTQATHDLTDELQSHLVRFLPNYMIPAVFLRIYRWPKTPNGKVDREALVSLFYDLQCSSKEAAFTLSQIKVDILEIWKKNSEIKDLRFK